MRKNEPKQFIKKGIKIIIIILISILVILALAFIYLNSHSGKQFLKREVSSYLSKKLKTNFSLGSIDFNLPNDFEIHHIYVEDKSQDSLFYAEELSVSIALLKLIKGETDIKKIALSKAKINIYRARNDSLFNFQFILDAFSSNKKSEKVNTDTSALKLVLRHLNLHEVALRFRDEYEGSEITAAIKNLDVTLNKFETDKLRFGLNSLDANGIKFSMLTTKRNAKQTNTVASDNKLILIANSIQLQDVTADIQNQIDGLHSYNYIQHLVLKKTNMNLAKQALEIHSIHGSKVIVKLRTPLEKTVAINDSIVSKSATWIVKIAEIKLDDNSLKYDDPGQSKTAGFDVSHLDISALSLRSQNLFYSVDSSSANIIQFKLKDHSGVEIDSLHLNVLLTKHQLVANELYFKTPQSLLKNKIHLSFDELKTLTLSPEKSTVNIQLNESVISMNELFVLLPTLKKSLKEEKLKNQLIKINTQITGTLQRLNIPLLQMAGLNGSSLNARAVVLNITKPKSLLFDLTLLPSIISKRDLVKFVVLSPAALAQLPENFYIKATANGSMQSLFADVNLSANNLLLDAKATLKMLDNKSKFHYDALIRSGHVQRDLLFAFIPKEKFPRNIELPQHVFLAGTLIGDMNNITSDIKLDGSYGTISARGYLKDFANKETAHYDLKFTSKQFAIGKLLKQDTLLSTVSMQADIKGSGFNPKTMKVNIESEINSIGFKNYDYHQIAFHADLDHGNLNSSGSVKDPNVALHYLAIANISDPNFSGELWLYLDSARLKQLQLVKDTFNIAMRTHFKAENISADQLNASLQMDSLRMQVQSEQMFVDSIRATAKSTEGKNEIEVRSPMAELYVDGVFQYNKIVPSLIQYINGFYKLKLDSTAIVSTPQQIKFNGILKEHPLMKYFMKGLQKFEPISFTGNYNSDAADSALNVDVKMPFVSYKGKQLYKGNISLQSANEQIKYVAKVDTLQAGETKLFATALSGYLAHDSVIAEALTKDAAGTVRYSIGASASVNGNAYLFRLRNNLLLNQKAWTVNPENAIHYSPAGILVDDFIMSNKQSSIEIQSENQQPNSLINISVNNFLISDITSLLQKDTLLARGILNAKLKVSEFEKPIPAFVGDIKVDSLYYKKQALGNLDIHTQKVNDDNISANISLKGNQNDVVLIGNYYLNHVHKQFDADLNLNNFNVATLQAFSNGNISSASGSIDGNLKLYGKFANPEWAGILNLKNPAFRLSKFGTSYSITNQKIALKYPLITMNQFTIQDSAGNHLKIDGQLKATSLSNFDLDLNVDSKDFIVVNTPKATNDLVYGFAAINTDVKITGSLAAPNIQGSIGHNDFSDATLVLPEKNISKDAGRSVVRFIDKDTFDLPEKVLFVTAAPEKPSISTFLNYNLNVQVSPKASLTVIMDPSTGDELTVKGDAKLNIGVDPGGNIILAGNYDLQEGHYMLHYQFLQRKFNLLSGSTIAFGGGPLEAQVNIQAEYIANTNAIDLVGNELGNVDNRTATTFNQKIPFRVLLFIKGTLSKLQISFDIVLPAENRGLSNLIMTTVENKLTQLRSDPAAINKQVFSLLVLNRFVGEQSNDFFKGSGDGVSDMARQSVSKFLSAALDQIASDLIKGVDIDLNLNSYKDYRTGDEQQRTDLNIGVSKRFLDDRLSISVGKNLGIEGQDKSAKARQQSTASYMPDATVSYKLSKDGRYMIRAYSKNKFEVILDGYIVETGLSFIVSMDYEKFKELFSHKKKNKRRL